MAERDLLNKPMPLVIPEERDHNKRSIPAPILGKLGVQVRAPIIGAEADAPQTAAAAKNLSALPRTAKKSQLRKEPAGGSPQSPQGLRNKELQEPAKAYKAAYFNQDVGSTQAPNLRARPMAALRGEEGATDLKRVVLPPLTGSEAPQPEQIDAVLQRMLPVQDAQEASTAPSLRGLIALLSAYTKQGGMTHELLLQRQAVLEALVAMRKAALERMAHLTPAHLQRARTLTQAFLAQGEDPAQSETLVDDANALLREGHQMAFGLHARLKKMMGVKK